MICINITMKRPQVARIVMTLTAGDFSLTLARKLPVVGELKNLWFFSGEYFKIKSRKTVTYLKMCWSHNVALSCLSARALFPVPEE